ncbi:MAG: hypothetical protein HFJ17_05900 [Clostridia bacterium]|nr:hypothetical protein [Clostridia bacterium]
MRNRIKELIDKIPIKESKNISAFISIIISLIFVVISILSVIDLICQNLKILVIFAEISIGVFVCIYIILYNTLCIYVFKIIDKEIDLEQYRKKQKTIKKFKLTNQYTILTPYNFNMDHNEILGEIVESNLREENDKGFDFVDNINVVLMCSFINKHKLKVYAKVEDDEIKLMITNRDNSVCEENEVTYHFLEEYFVE